MSKNCGVCGVEFPARNGGRFCSKKCIQKNYRDAHKEYFIKYREEHHEHRLDYNRKYHQEHHAERLEYGKKRRAETKDEVHTYYKNLINSLKSEAFEHYGKECLFCGESDVRFLCFDHINNDGNAQRREIGRNQAMLRNLKEKDWPNYVVQVLCHNCNTRKERRLHYGTLPMARSNRRRKERVVNKYGGECACCGESDISVLQIDHMNGNGNKERSALGDGRDAVGSNRLYMILDKCDTTLPDYRILCCNCNQATHIYGSCPHANK